MIMSDRTAEETLDMRGGRCHAMPLHAADSRVSRLPPER